MVSQVHLPHVQAIRLAGMQPVFKKDISRSIQPGINLILGGNALGKTTTIQSIVFALSGGAGSSIVEPDKSFRWDHRWFSGRIGEAERSSATVEVDIRLGKRLLGIRRRFESSRVDAVRIGGADSRWIEARADAEKVMLDELARAGIASFDDFAFLTLRLLYLSEDRRLLAWDADAQARIMMVLSRDVVDESAFRKSRADLKFADSRRRHAHVAVGKLHSQLASLIQPSKRRPTEERSQEERPNPASQLRSITVDLEKVHAELRRVRVEAKSTDQALSVRSNEVEHLRALLDDAEIAEMQRALAAAEKTSALPLAKLLERAICPACGTRQAALQKLAQERQDRQECVMCGSDEARSTPEGAVALHSQLAEKLNAQRDIDQKRKRLSMRIRALEDTELELLSKLADMRSQLEAASSSVAAVVPERRSNKPAELREALSEQQAVEAQLAADVETQQSSIARKYQRFIRDVSDRIDRLKELYESYATKFLGLQCTLEDVESEGRLFTPRVFVPRFNGVTRYHPETCSEAQQFFLDIAFRMALIDLASELSGTPGAFFCETPENALDLSYIENVAAMFKAFAQNGHSILLTANIQREGLARELMRSWGKQDESGRVLQLLDFGNLSEVQRKLEADLRSFSHRPGR